jgi:hypothetical protein
LVAAVEPFKRLHEVAAGIAVTDGCTRAPCERPVHHFPRGVVERVERPAAVVVSSDRSGAERGEGDVGGAGGACGWHVAAAKASR